MTNSHSGPAISATERERRRADINAETATFAAAGLVLEQCELADVEEWAAGRIDIDEVIRRGLAMYPRT